MLFFRYFLCLFLLMPSLVVAAEKDMAELSATSDAKRLAYLVSDARIPFWQIMARGITNASESAGYDIQVYSAENNSKKELQNTIAALKNRVDGIIVSPTTSSACVTILAFAKKAGIPVVISDIGTDSGEYLSFISSDNYSGAYEIGKYLALKMIALGKVQGGVGIISIPQKRLNGQLRTSGFLKALKEHGVSSVGLKQQIDFSYAETYKYSQELIKENPDMAALWLQGSDRYQAALDAIADAGKQEKILLVTFDAEPEFIDLIQKGVLVGAAMQQPFLMGEKAVHALQLHFKGEKVMTDQQLEVLSVTEANIADKLQVIQRNVLGLE
ncbi:substrate-binding domain-containing protein [Neptuniibacter sp. QD29_5]|uniref:substrate-binding domain-containing protein n=1 Tax=Neptuniibacter sp. QD29_5 TaxID=3398207 RepID=UPI0039F4E7A4